MRKSIVVAIFALVSLGSLVVLGGSPNFVSNLLESVKNNPVAGVFSPSIQRAKWGVRESNQKTLTTGQKADIPQYILYDQLFRLVVKFKKKAVEKEADGTPIPALRDYFQRAGKLSDEQTQSLQEIAANYVTAVEQIDSQAHTIIQTARERIPQGRATIDKKLLEPPAELLTLQKKREELALEYRDRLKSSLSPEGFELLVGQVQQSISTVWVDDGSKLETIDGEIAPKDRYPADPNGGF